MCHCRSPLSVAAPFSWESTVLVEVLKVASDDVPADSISDQMVQSQPHSAGRCIWDVNICSGSHAAFAEIQGRLHIAQLLGQLVRSGNVQLSNIRVRRLGVVLLQYATAIHMKGKPKGVVMGL